VVLTWSDEERLTTNLIPFERLQGSFIGQTLLPAVVIVG
jgi:hypothetical protein